MSYYFLSFITHFFSHFPAHFVTYSYTFLQTFVQTFLFKYSLQQTFVHQFLQIYPDISPTNICSQISWYIFIHFSNLGWNPFHLITDCILRRRSMTKTYFLLGNPPFMSLTLSIRRLMNFWKDLPMTLVRSFIDRYDIVSEMSLSPALGSMITLPG